MQEAEEEGEDEDRVVETEKTIEAVEAVEERRPLGNNKPLAEIEN